MRDYGPRWQEDRDDLASCRGEAEERKVNSR